MSQYNVFQAIVMSFFSGKLYRDVATNWGGKAFFYLLLILALSWIIPIIGIQHMLNQGFTTHADEYLAQVPVLTIKDGKVSTPENHPYQIIDPATHALVAVIDTTGQYTTLESAKTSILLTQTALISQSRPQEIKTNTIPTTLTAVIDPQQIKEYIKDYIGYAWIILFIAFLIATYIYRIIQALLYSILGKIFSAICGVAISYTQVLQIMMVAITPALVVASVLEFLNITLPRANLIYFALAMLYLIFGILANKKKAA